jgi:hypothetical protein
LSIAFEEISGDKIILAHPSESAPDESSNAEGGAATDGGERSGDDGERERAE